MPATPDQDKPISVIGRRTSWGSLRIFTAVKRQCAFQLGWNWSFILGWPDREGRAWS